MNRHWILLLPLILCTGFLASCRNPKTPPTAASTGKSGVAPAIVSVKTNAEALWQADQKRAATAAASVVAAQAANTNQPVSPFTDFVNQELGVAARNLPPPDPLVALEVEKRRVLVFAGKAEEASALYRQASQDAEKLKVEAAELKQRADAAQAALMRAEAEHMQQLIRNQMENQAKLDAAEKKALEADEKAKNERHKLIFRALLGLGLLCIAGGIALGVMTNGVMLIKSLILAGAGALCIGLAQVISHPWFDRIAGTGLALAAIGGGIYLWLEKRGATARDGYLRTIETIDRTGVLETPVTDKKGKPSTLRKELADELDRPQKDFVDAMQRKLAVKAAKQS